MTILRRTEKTSLTSRLDALSTAIELGEDRLPADVLIDASEAVDRSRERHELSLAHTVIALAGATGSGKSSLFNSFAGMNLSRVGVRRPTTSEPVACVWGTVGVTPLLDWLGIPRRHQIARESVLDSGEQDELDGLVLIDLPDYDSTETEHRDVVDHFVEMVDLFVWVLDPQKYADAALHEQYLQRMAEHRNVTLVVLNQVDKLDAEELQQCLSDLRRLLVEDGLDRVPVLPVSARTGQGLDELGDLLRGAVSRRKAVDERTAGDARQAAEMLHDASGDGEPGTVGSATRQGLIDTLVAAVGVDAVADAAGRSYTEQSHATAGWPVARWARRWRPNPSGQSNPSDGSGHDGSSAPHSGSSPGSAVPTPSPVQRERVQVAVRSMGDAAARSAPGPWRSRIREVAAESGEQLPDVLDEAVASTGLAMEKRPRWWPIAGVAQWVAFVAVVLGAAWLLVVAGLSFFDMDVPEVAVRGLPVPTVVVIAGVVIGLVVAALAGWAARRGSRRRSEAVRRALRTVIMSTADSVVVAPIEAELDRYREFSRALSTARS